jgi:hypothetical protein
MVVTDLSEELIQEGRKLVAKLDESGVEVPAALWILFPDIQAWKLALSLPVVAEESPKRGYRLVQRALADLGDEVERLSLEDVAVLKPDAPLLLLLRVALSTGPAISRVSFIGNVINGELFPDALVYRVT